MATYPSNPAPNYPLEIEGEWRTSINKVDSGKETRKQKSLFPRYNVKVNYTTLTTSQLQILWDFYQARNGSYEAFYLYDLVSLSHYAEYIATGDGQTYIFDIPGKITSLQSIYKNGVLQSSGVNYEILVGGGDSSSDRLRFINENTEIDIFTLIHFNSELYGGTRPNGNLFKWNGSSAWIQSASQFNSQSRIYDLIVFNNGSSSNLYGGTYPNGLLFKWNGSSAWTQVASQFGSEQFIFSLVEFNSELYGGSGPNGNLLKWNGSSAWIQVAPQFGSETYISKLIIFNSEIYAGTYPNGNLLKWNGSSAWIQVAPQFGSEIRIWSLITFNSELYGGTQPNGNLLKWNGSSAWVQVAPMYNSEAYIYSLIVFNSELYGGTRPNGNLLKWNGSSAWVQAAPTFGDEMKVFDLDLFNDEIYGVTGSEAKLLKWNSSSAWTLAADQLQDSPAAGDIITTDFTGYLRMRVRFEDDMLNRQMFYRALHTTGISLKGLKPA